MSNEQGLMINNQCMMNNEWWIRIHDQWLLNDEIKSEQNIMNYK